MPEATQKACTCCNKVLDLSMFNKAKTGKYGLRGDCKYCQRSKRKINPVSDDRPSVFVCTECKKELDYDLTNFKSNKYAKYGLTYECRKCLSKRNTKWARDTYQQRKWKMKEWRQKNADKINEYRKRYLSKHKEAVYSVCRNYRARKQNAVGSHNKSDIDFIFKMQKGRCANCNCKLNKYHVDHVFPLARGGSNDKYNLQILCPTCNVTKWCKDPIVFAQENGRLL